jgi:hypothetical protein
MTQEKFVAIIKQVVFDPAVSEEALRPAGRKPHEVLVRMWDWYTGLSQRGIRVHGIELSPAMAARLQEEPQADGIGATIGTSPLPRRAGHSGSPTSSATR